jgi:hypothetical protein
MRNERKRILEMLSRGEITVEQADRMLADIAAKTPATRKKPRYLHIITEKSNQTGDRVNLRIPIKLLGYGLKLTRLIPAGVRHKVNSALAKVGMNFTITDDNIVDFLDALTDISVEIDGGEKVQIFCR